MKNIVRTLVLVLALSGAVSGVVSNHTARAEQVAVLSHQGIASAMPMPGCGPATCGIRGGK